MVQRISMPSEREQNVVFCVFGAMKSFWTKELHERVRTAVVHETITCTSGKAQSVSYGSSLNGMIASSRRLPGTLSCGASVPDDELHKRRGTRSQSLSRLFLLRDILCDT